MLEVRSETHDLHQTGVIYRFNKQLEKPLLGANLPREQLGRIKLALKSAQGVEILSPSSKRKGLLKQFRPEVVDRLTRTVDGLVDSIDGEFRLGSKILENDPFREALDRGYRELQIIDPDQEAAFDYWVKNADRLSKDEPIYRRILSGLSDKLGELSQTTRLLVMNTGLGIRNIGQKGNIDLLKQAGDKFIDAPVSLQVQSDLVEAAQRETVGINSSVEEVARRYGLDEVSVGIVTHPDFRKRIAASLSLNMTIYTAPRQILGWGAFAGLLTSPGFREMVETNGTNLTLVSAGVLLGISATRMFIDYSVLKARNYSPDILETVAAQMGGHIGSKFELKVNPWYGLLGTPIDIAISSLQPPYSAAWFANPPYSIPAYLLAMAVDQGVFSVTNSVWSVIRKNKKDKDVIINEVTNNEKTK